MSFLFHCLSKSPDYKSKYLIIFCLFALVGCSLKVQIGIDTIEPNNLSSVYCLFYILISHQLQEIILSVVSVIHLWGIYIDENRNL